MIRSEYDQRGIPALRVKVSLEPDGEVHAKEMTFKVSTGNSRTMLREQQARAMGWNPGTQETAEFPTPHGVARGWAARGTLSVRRDGPGDPDFQAPVELAVIMDADWNGEEYPGVTGNDLLQHFEARFDGPNQVMELREL